MAMNDTKFSYRVCIPVERNWQYIDHLPDKEENKGGGKEGGREEIDYD